MRGFSAVAIYFAHHLRHRWSEGTATAEGAGSMSDMPLGLIQAAWGGTPAEAWTSREGLDAEPSLKPLLDHWDSLGEKNELAPACLFNGMIAPMRNYSIRGVIWYQGEANVGRGDQYRTLFPRLIRDWRAQFRQGDFSFYFVQLAPFRYGGMDPAQLPEAWDAQRRALELPNTGMAVATDLGDFADIHPRAKDEVGRRLALWALAQDYSDKSIVYSGPMVDSWEVEGSWIRIRFRHVAEGLVDPGEPLREFTICGEDRKFVPAQARVEGTHDVLVWADGVDRPVAARFAWQDTPQPNLFNSAGLPASPFRTDDFVLLSAERSH
jgi:sialate O-acetylesterase